MRDLSFTNRVVPRMRRRTTVYMAHPLAGDFHANIAGASEWYRFLRRLSVAGVGRILGGTTRFEKSVFMTTKVVTPEGATELKYELANPFGDVPVIAAPWLACTVPDSMYPGGRVRACADGLILASMFDEVWWVGGKVSGGMYDEGRVAPVVRDLTQWGAMPPDWELQPEMFYAQNPEIPG